MIRTLQENLLEIHTYKGELIIEQETGNSVRMEVINPVLALSMVGLYTKNELKEIVINNSYHRMNHQYVSDSLGKKKVIQSIFSEKNHEGQEAPAIIFLSEDTTYTYELSVEEWKEIISFFAFIEQQY